jgi:hypothetical protein
VVDVRDERDVAKFAQASSSATTSPFSSNSTP